MREDLMFPKPSGRVINKKLRNEFVSVRPWCQKCGSAQGLQIHHLKLPGMSPRSDVFVNFLRLCWKCHSPEAHTRAGRLLMAKEKLIDETAHRGRYRSLEEEMFGDARWSMEFEWRDALAAMIEEMKECLTDM